MLGKVFFDSESFNPSPFWENTVLLDLTGASKYEADKIYPAGRYRIQVAPGKSWYDSGDGTGLLDITNDAGYMDFEERITQPFVVKAYCGSDATASGYGTNPYEGQYKVNGIAPGVKQNGIDVNHIFGAGGGNVFDPSYMSDKYYGGGGNCLGNGNTCQRTYTSGKKSVWHHGAGSCLHLLPVGGVFGVNYLRAYHLAAFSNVPGGAYGGGASRAYLGVGTEWVTRGGNSPYGSGGTPESPEGKGVGGGGKIKVVSYEGIEWKIICSAGAYFNGNNWVDHPSGTQPSNGLSSFIRITYLGGL